MTTNAEARPIYVEVVDPRRWFALVTVLLAAFMQLMDVSIVNVAIPSIRQNLSASYADIEWVVAGYQLAFAAVLITGGRLGDIFGRKRLFLVGITGFTIASALCGLAQIPGMLVGSRLLQGTMGAIMFPQVFSVIQVTFPIHERSKAFGAVAAIMGIATTTGPLLGGLLIQASIAGLSWRPIFLVNVPIGVVALLAGCFFLSESRPPRALRLDIIGMLVASAGLLALLYPLVQGRELGWPAWTFVLMASGVTMLALFTLYERHKTRVDGSPLVVLSLFRERAFVVGLLVSLILFSGVSSFFLTFSIFLQIGLGFSALHTSLTTTSWAVCSAIVSAGSVWLTPRLGRTSLSIGTALLTIGMTGVILTIHHYGTDVQSHDLVVALAVAGLGMGCVVAPLVNVILSGIRLHDAGSASGILSTVQQIGGAVGVVVIGVIFFGVQTNQADGAALSVVPMMRGDLQAAGISVAVQDRVVSGFQVCFHDQIFQQDPSAVPPSCRRLTVGREMVQLQPGNIRHIQQVIEAANDAARGQDFSISIQRTLWYQVVVFAISSLLSFFLPQTRVERASPMT